LKQQQEFGGMHREEATLRKRGKQKKATEVEASVGIVRSVKEGTELATRSKREMATLLQTVLDIQFLDYWRGIGELVVSTANLAFAYPDGKVLRSPREAGLFKADQRNRYFVPISQDRYNQTRQRDRLIIRDEPDLPFEGSLKTLKDAIKAKRPVVLTLLGDDGSGRLEIEPDLTHGDDASVMLVKQGAEREAVSGLTKAYSTITKGRKAAADEGKKVAAVIGIITSPNFLEKNEERMMLADPVGLPKVPGVYWIDDSKGLSPELQMPQSQIANSLSRSSIETINISPSVVKAARKGRLVKLDLHPGALPTDWKVWDPLPKKRTTYDVYTSSSPARVALAEPLGNVLRV
jgi:hypothetical protein